jgi:enoyl-CoA hydratase/carnithine racemase
LVTISLMAVSFAVEGGIGTITVDRPPANSYEAAFVGELGASVEAAAADDAVKVVVVRSASEKFFSAGADIKAFTESTVEANMAMIRAMQGVLLSIGRTPKVFIAEIGGHALGGGLEIALACDLRFGAEGSYRIGLPEVTLGLLPGSGGTQRLPRLVGWSLALDLMVSGRTLTPEEAFDAGILNRLFPAAALHERTHEYAGALAAGATKAIGNIKLAVHEGLALGLERGLDRESDLMEELFRSDDGSEGPLAFAEKRAPRFNGR